MRFRLYCAGHCQRVACSVNQSERATLKEHVTTCAYDRLFVITGGPGSGKSTLVDALGGRGFARTAEAGRAIIRDQMRVGGHALPWHDPLTFAELMLSWELRSYRWAQRQNRTVVFDRGIPDVIGYLRVMNCPVPEHMNNAARLFRYNRQVFIAPHWPEIFGQDAERRQTPDEAARTHDAMVETYSAYDYELVPLPIAPIEDRVRFIMDRVAAFMSARTR